MRIIGGERLVVGVQGDVESSCIRASTGGGRRRVTTTRVRADAMRFLFLDARIIGYRRHDNGTGRSGQSRHFPAQADGRIRHDGIRESLRLAGAGALPRLAPGAAAGNGGRAGGRPGR